MTDDVYKIKFDEPVMTPKRIANASEALYKAMPVSLRPLKYVPGRNRAEKRRYQALYRRIERGTATKFERVQFGQLRLVLSQAGKEHS